MGTARLKLRSSNFRLLFVDSPAASHCYKSLWSALRSQYSRTATHSSHLAPGGRLRYQRSQWGFARNLPWVVSKVDDVIRMNPEGLFVASAIVAMAVTSGDPNNNVRPHRYSAPVRLRAERTPTTRPRRVRRTAAETDCVMANTNPFSGLQHDVHAAAAAANERWSWDKDRDGK